MRKLREIKKIEGRPLGQPIILKGNQQGSDFPEDLRDYAPKGADAYLTGRTMFSECRFPGSILREQIIPVQYYKTN